MFSKQEIKPSINTLELEKIDISNTTPSKSGKCIKQHIRFIIDESTKDFRFTPKENDTSITEFKLKKTLINLYINDVLESSIDIFSLKDNTKIFNNINQDCTIEFHFPFKNVLISLPEKMNSHLIDFLKRYIPDKKYISTYCCTHFAYELIHGIAETKAMEEEDHKVNVTKLIQNVNEAQLAPGDIIYLQNKKVKSNFHYAVYIGNESYLSLFGHNGPLCVTTIEEMNKAWNTDLAQLVQLGRINRNASENTMFKVGCVIGAAAFLFFSAKCFNRNVVVPNLTNPSI